MIKNIDHVATFCRNNDLEETLSQWEKAGFLVRGDRLVSGGRKNGFIQFTGGYIELCSVVDEKLFSSTSSNLESELRKNPAIHFMVLANSNPRQTWEKIKYKFPELAVEEDSYFGELPQFSFCSFPLSATPGCYVSSICYQNKENAASIKNLSIGSNTIFGVTGIQMVSSDAEKESKAWRDTLSLVGADLVQDIEWISEDEFVQAYGGWPGPSPEYNRLGVVKLGAENLNIARADLSKAGFLVTEHSEQLIVKKDSNTGLAFLIGKGSAETFLRPQG